MQGYRRTVSTHWHGMQKHSLVEKTRVDGERWRDSYRFMRLLAFWLAASMRDTLRIACRERGRKKETGNVRRNLAGREHRS